jgi:hypothetical protein
MQNFAKNNQNPARQKICRVHKKGVFRMSSFMPAKDNRGIMVLAKEDSRFGQVKIFDKLIMTPVAVSENGYIGIYQAAGSMQVRGGMLPKFEKVPEILTVINISEVTEFDLIVDNKSGLGGAIVGALLFDGAGAVVGQSIASGKAKSIDLQIKTTNFNNPQIVVPLFRSGHHSDSSGLVRSMGFLGSWGASLAKTATGKGLQLKQEIQELMSQLDNLLQIHLTTQVQGVVVQQTSDADELAKFKKLLDDGVISQDEFDAKKKQLLGI